MSHVQSRLLSQPKVVRTSGKTSAQQSLCQWGAGLDSTCETQNRGETEELGACATRKAHRPISNTPGAFFQRAPQRSNDSPPGLCGTLRVAFRCYQNHWHTSLGPRTSNRPRHQKNAEAFHRPRIVGHAEVKSRRPTSCHSVCN